MGLAILITRQSRLGYIGNIDGKIIAFDTDKISGCIEEILTRYIDAALKSLKSSGSKITPFNNESFIRMRVENYLSMSPWAYSATKDGRLKLASLAKDHSSIENDILASIFKNKAYIFNIKVCKENPVKGLCYPMVRLLFELAVDINKNIAISAFGFNKAGIGVDYFFFDHYEYYACDEVEYTVQRKTKPRGFFNKIFNQEIDYSVLGTIRQSEIKSISSSDGTSIIFKLPLYDFNLHLEK